MVAYKHTNKTPLNLMFSRLTLSRRVFHLGKHDSPDDYAELEVDNQAFGIEVPELLKDHIDFETLGKEMVKNIIIVDDHYFSKK